jgi:hypothetical protein
MEDSINQTAAGFEDLNCPEFTDSHSEMLKHVSFWVEGTLSCSIAVAGVFGNVGSSIILSQKGKPILTGWSKAILKGDTEASFFGE